MLFSDFVIRLNKLGWALVGFKTYVDDEKSLRYDLMVAEKGPVGGFFKDSDIVSVLEERLKLVLEEAKDRTGFNNLVEVYVDGACEGNPGKAGIGVCCETLGIEISRYIGSRTNNVAEWTALEKAVEIINSKGLAPNTTVVFKMDSELVVNQVKGTYKVRDSVLRKIAAKVAREWPTGAIIEKIPRGQNKADKLAKGSLRKWM